MQRKGKGTPIFNMIRQEMILLSRKSALRRLGYK